MATTQQPQKPNYRIITVNLMDLPKQIEQWEARGVEADRYEYFPPAGSYVLLLRPIKPNDMTQKG